MSWAECSGCGETFSSDTGFDKHLDRKGQCRNPATARRANGIPLYRRIQTKAGRQMWALLHPAVHNPFATQSREGSAR